jgi:hypothetical protein
MRSLIVSAVAVIGLWLGTASPARAQYWQQYYYYPNTAYTFSYTYPGAYYGYYPYTSAYYTNPWYNPYVSAYPGYSQYYYYNWYNPYTNQYRTWRWYRRF